MSIKKITLFFILLFLPMSVMTSSDKIIRKYNNQFLIEIIMIRNFIVSFFMGECYNKYIKKGFEWLLHRLRMRELRN